MSSVTYLLHKVQYSRLIHFNRLLYTGLGNWNDDLSTSMKHDIENHWHNNLGSDGYDKNSQKPKYYVLSMFPYPSGHLHMGHVRVYTISDTMARFHRMNGKNVIHPMGWDAFGLPAENAAIEHGVKPIKWTQQNIKHMKQQLNRLGCSFDWDSELTTCDPAYYCWTQFIFLKMYQAGLVYKKKALVNWDPVDQTVLAEEQVDANGCSWRSGAKVEKKLLNQWFIRTTRFSKSLLDGLEDPMLSNWRDIIKVQKHWIGECDGTNLEFTLHDTSQENDAASSTKDTLSIWTPRPELVYNASFVAVLPGSVLDSKENWSDESNIGDGICRRLSLHARNPFTGEFLPVFVTDQVHYSYGAHCHLGIPEISESDRLFATVANIPTSSTPEEEETSATSAEDVMVARNRVCEAAQQRNIGGYPSSSKLRDWLISRQRYWGTPIPMVNCSTCGTQPVPFNELPVVLPEVNALSSRGKSPLLESPEWLNTSCPKCGGNATRETDTMDTFVDSSWYFLRYLDPHNTERPFNSNIASKMMPVDLYIGGKEHAVLHLYYARFFNHFLHWAGMVPYREPFKHLLVQGMVMGRSYRVKGTGRYLAKDQVDLSGKKPVEMSTGQPVVVAWEKMSKSKHNGVDPETMFKDYGTDTTRLLVLADVAPTSHRNWTTDTFPGILKWQNRLWLTIRDFLEARSKLNPDTANKIPETPDFEDQEDKLFDSRNYHLKGVTFNYSCTFQLSVAISKMQALTNSIRRAKADVMGQGLQFERALATQLITLAPMAPHFASELWSGFVSAPHKINTLSGEVRWDRGVLDQEWPQVDLDYRLELICKVNRFDVCNVRLPRHELDNLTHDDAMELALSNSDLQRYTVGRKIVDTSFTLYPSYEAVINITTEKIGKKQTQIAIES